MSKESFLSSFRFNGSLIGAIGIEREFFLLDKDNYPSPHSPEFLAIIGLQEWTYELSACQVEHRTPPLRGAEEIRNELQQASKNGSLVADRLNLRLGCLELAPLDMTTQVYPYDQRYQTIVKSLPPETLSAACRVAGLHIHVGVSGIDEALQVHNVFVKNLEKLCRLGDHSDGERLRLYKQMAKNWQPPEYASVEHLLDTAHEQGFEGNPRNCWHLIRISRHGTVELRMFGMTANLDEVIGWVEIVRQLMA